MTHKLTIYLKGGNSFDVNVGSYAVYKNGLGAFAKFGWTDASPKVVRLDLDEVQAVIEHV